jgi:hypothetical protein
MARRPLRVSEVPCAILPFGLTHNRHCFHPARRLTLRISSSDALSHCVCSREEKLLWHLNLGLFPLRLGLLHVEMNKIPENQTINLF